jgi:phosphohistidine phosphatase
MKYLYLVRHAKSSWKNEDIPDRDRPLKGRGIRDAYSSGEWLKGQGHKPDLILSSPATRALHTALIFAKSLNYSYSKIIIEEAIYTGSAAGLQDLVKELDNAYEKVFLFGHNPYLTEFVNSCVNYKIDKVPTSGVACLQFDEKNWKGTCQRAELVFFDYPKKRKT